MQCFCFLERLKELSLRNLSNDFAFLKNWRNFFEKIEEVFLKISKQFLKKINVIVLPFFFEENEAVF